MSSYPLEFRDRPLSANLSIQLRDETPLIAVPEAPCVPFFKAWDIAQYFQNALIQSFILFDPNQLEPIPYPDGCFQFIIKAHDILCPGDCVNFVVIVKNNLGQTISINGLQVFIEGLSPLAEDCNGAFVQVVNPFEPDGTLLGTTMEVSALVNGKDFGTTIYFRCDPAAFVTSVGTWDSNRNGTLDPAFGFPAMEDPITSFIYYFAHSGTLWTNSSHVVQTVTQTAGPPVPDPSYFGVGIIGCMQWKIGLVAGYDYTGTQFTITSTVDGNPLPDVIYTCDA